MLTLTILGCDGSHASAGGAASGYLVREWDSGTTIWVDAGPGTFANLQRFCDPRSVDAIVLSHSHGDHWTDIDGFLTAGRWTAKPPWGPVRVLAAPGIADNLIQAPDDVLEFEEITASTVAKIGPVTLTFSRTDHPPVTFAVRIEGAGRVLGYSADTGPDWSFKAFGPGIEPRALRGDLHTRARGDCRTYERPPGRRAQHAKPVSTAFSSPISHRSYRTRPSTLEALDRFRSSRSSGR